ncbi:hypothetical protein GTQ40_13760 [Flavobacteriaceae bacterium R38]|nr:hypothetical protein [Flavobacteriaceae bacterium R38]
MGKKKEKAKKKAKKEKKLKAKQELVATVIEIPKKCKSKCCNKYKKGNRCKRCPMFDLLKKVA